MLKSYVYHDSDLLRATPFSIEQIERSRVKLPTSFKHTDDPNEADFFWIPIDLGHWEAYHGGVKNIRSGLPRLPYWNGNEARHVAYFCSDGADPVGLPLIMFRQSFYKDNKDVNAVAWPYAVEDFGDLVTDDFGKLPYDVSFVGSRVSSKSRIESFDSVAREPRLRSFLDDSKLHWGKVEYTPVGEFRKELFKQSLAESKMVLCARGGGLSCYRFFEAMSAGRVPVLFADDWELPHSHVIDWDKCIIQIEERDAKDTGKILLSGLRGNNSDKELSWMGRYARHVWEKYLAPATWPDVMEMILSVKLWELAGHITSDGFMKG